MKLKSYLAKIEMISPQGVIYYETKRVVPTMSYIEISQEELDSGMKNDIVRIPDLKKTFKYVLIYVDVENRALGKPTFSMGANCSYTLPGYPENVVEIIPNTEEDFETEIVDIVRVEDNPLFDKKSAKKIKLKRYGGDQNE